MIRVRLSLSYPALEAGLRALLAADPEIVVLPQAETASEADDEEAADVRIMTSAAFAGHSAAGNEEDPEAGIIIVGAEITDARRLWSSRLPGGLLPIDVSAEELRAAVRAVAAGLVVGTRSLLSTSDEMNLAPGPLTEREMEVLGLLSTGLANKQIAAHLGISEHTIKFHVSSIYGKLNVTNRAEAVREGLRNGWIAL